MEMAVNNQSEIFVHDPGNNKKIDSVFAILSEDEQGNEGIDGVMMNGKMTPFITGSEKAIEMMISIIKSMPKVKGKKHKLVRYTKKELVREL